MPKSKTTAAEIAKGSLVKKFMARLLPSSYREKSLGSNPLTKRPESSVTRTGTITWFTLRVILKSSSCELLPVLSGVAPPSGTVLTSTGCGGGFGLPSVAGGAGLAVEGGTSFPGTWSAVDDSLGGRP